MFQDNLFRELVVDNFAGGGGASTGMELALGYPVDIAVNHDADAIAMHKVNYPYTRHFQEDVFAIDPERVTGGRRIRRRVCVVCVAKGLHGDNRGAVDIGGRHESNHLQGQRNKADRERRRR